MYQCLKEKFADLEKKISSVVKMINKYGYSVDFRIINEETKLVPYRRLDTISNTIITLGKVSVNVVNYEFQMSNFKVGNYVPVAVIEHDVVISNNGEIKNMVHKFINNFDIPQNWWSIRGNCDDCNDKYNRKRTIMLQDINTKEFRQIGTSCLKKYLGINTYNVIHNYMTVEEILEEQINELQYFVDYDCTKYVDTKCYLSNAIDIINNSGYTKEITARTAFKQTIDNNIPTNDAIKKAEEIINFFKNADLNSEIFDDDFIKSIYVAVVSDYSKCSGLVAYAPLAYNFIVDKLQKIQEKELEKSSEFIGEIGEHIDIFVKPIGCYAFETQYGFMYINKFIQKDTNNILIWKTSTKSFNTFDAKFIHIKATIKEHSVYKESIKQTVLTRVKEI